MPRSAPVLWPAACRSRQGGADPSAGRGVDGPPGGHDFVDAVPNLVGEPNVGGTELGSEMVDRPGAEDGGGHRRVAGSDISKRWRAAGGSRTPGSARRCPCRSGPTASSRPSGSPALSLWNPAAGIAVLEGWRTKRSDDPGHGERPPLDTFRRLPRDIYLPAGDIYFWQVRSVIAMTSTARCWSKRSRPGSESSWTFSMAISTAAKRVISRFGLAPRADATYLVSRLRQWNLERPDPRASGQHQYASRLR
jgi:hypothetical protein